MNESKKILGIVGALIVLSALAYLLSQMQGSGTYTSVATKPILPPPYTAEVKAQLAASHGFQVLVSYTDRGFAPVTVSIKKGETVRFTNNTYGDLWVAATGASGTIYPGTGNECGQSAFDSCRLIGPGAFWEFTFTKSGTWGYQNNRDTKMAGVIRVQ